MRARYVRLLGYFVYSLPFGILYAFPLFKVIPAKEDGLWFRSSTNAIAQHIQTY